jgi:hypothetical protein
MMNRKQLAFYSSFRIPPSALLFILSILSILFIALPADVNGGALLGVFLGLA